MQEIICALCGKNQQKKLLYKATFTQKNVTSEVFSARRAPDRIHYQLNICTNCGLIFSSPIFPDAKISKLYEKSFLSYPDQVDYITKTYINLLESIRSKLPKDPSILDIGCGNGFFLDALKKRGFKKLYGVEPSKKMVDSIPLDLRKNVKQSLFRKNLFPEKTFDLICCFHTLDHVVNPNEFVSETYTLLKKNGVAIFVLHDTSALSVRLFGEKSPIFDIEHIYLFNKKIIATLFRQNGFSNIAAYDLKNTYPLSYWIQMAGIPQFLKKQAVKLLFFTKLGNIPLSLKGGNMYVVAQKK